MEVIIVNENKQKEHAITLIALIITIIVLIILAAVTIKNALDLKIADVAVNAAEKYTDESYKELGELNRVSSKIEGALDKLKYIVLTKDKDIGKYVEYEVPKDAKYEVSATNSGLSNIKKAELLELGLEETDLTQVFTTEEMRWRIWDIEDEKLYLIGEPTKTGGAKRDGRLWLYGANGYNNGIYLLNEISKTCYKNEVYKNIEVRNITIEDIEEVINKERFNYEEYTDIYKYGEEKTYGAVNKNRPAIWNEYEKTGDNHIAKKSNQDKIYLGLRR